MSGGGRGRPPKHSKATTSFRSLLESAEGGSGQSLQTETMSNTGEDVCRHCDSVVACDPIICGSCHKNFHPSSHCTGLKSLTIQAIKEEGNGMIRYICTACRCAPASPSDNPGAGNEWKEAMSQMFELVRSLSINVSKLTDKVSQMSEDQSTRSVTGHTETLNKKDLYSELYEFEERKKRMTSIVVKGIKVRTKEEFADKFRVVCQFLLNTSPQITSMHCVNQENCIYRVTFQDKAARLAITAVAKNLAGSEHKDIYISRDLTFQQRREIAANRAKSRDQQGRRSEVRRGETGSNPPNAPLSGSNAISTDPVQHRLVLRVGTHP